MCSKNEPSIFDNMQVCGGCGGGVFPDDRQDIDVTGHLAHFECLGDVALRQLETIARDEDYAKHTVAYNAEHGTHF